MFWLEGVETEAMERMSRGPAFFKGTGSVGYRRSRLSTRIPGPLDVAQFVLTNVNGAAGSEYQLLREYHEALQAQGVEGFSFEACKRA